MKSLNLLIAFIFGLVYLPAVMMMNKFGVYGYPVTIVLLLIVIAVALFAYRSLKLGESKIGAIVVLVVDILLFFLIGPFSGMSSGW